MLQQSRDTHAAVFVFVDMERFFPFLCFLGGYLVLSEVVLSCELLVHLGVFPFTYFLINEYMCVHMCVWLQFYFFCAQNLTN